MQLKNYCRCISTCMVAERKPWKLYKKTDSLKENLKRFEEIQNKTHEDLRTNVMDEVTKVASGLQQLYDAAKVALDEVRKEVNGTKDEIEEL